MVNREIIDLLFDGVFVCMGEGEWDGMYISNPLHFQNAVNVPYLISCQIHLIKVAETLLGLGIR